MIDLTAIQAKSDQMNAVDFSHSIIFKVSKVEYFPNSKEQPVWIHFEGYEGRPYKPCKGMLRGLTRNDAWTMDEQSWVGKMMELYCDPSVKWGGKESGGIRISGLSSIKSNIKFPVQLNRTHGHFTNSESLKKKQSKNLSSITGSLELTRLNLIMPLLMS